MNARWIDDDAGLAELVRILRDEPRYGLDTEFMRERSYHPRLALLQVSWSSGLALVDPLAVDVGPLASVLDGPGLMIAHAGDQDLGVLDLACGTRPAHLFDTQVAAGFVGLGTPSLGVLVNELLGERLAKGDQLADWLRRPLDGSMREYAEADVAHLLALHDVLVERLTTAGRLEWALDESEEHRSRSLDPQDPLTAWWRIKGSRSFKGPTRGIAQEVAAWRERAAAASDQPPRFVLPDLALLAIIQRPPRTRDELANIRGLDGRHLRGGQGDEILAAIERGRALAPDALRAPPADRPGGPAAPIGALLTAYVSQLARDLGVDPTLLASRADVEALARGDEQARIARGWRAEAVAAPIQRLLRGEAGVAIQGKRLVLEDR